MTAAYHEDLVTVCSAAAIRLRRLRNAFAFVLSLGSVTANVRAEAADLAPGVTEALDRSGRAALWVYFTDKGDPSPGHPGR